MVGFTAGEGCFFVSIFKSSDHKLGKRVRLEFLITQHYGDTELLNSFKNYLGAPRFVAGSL